MNQVDICVMKWKLHFYLEIITQQFVRLSWAGRQVLSIKSLFIIPTKQQGTQRKENKFM